MNFNQFIISIFHNFSACGQRLFYLKWLQFSCWKQESFSAIEAYSSSSIGLLERINEKFHEPIQSQHLYMMNNEVWYQYCGMADFNWLLNTDPCAKQAWKLQWKCQSGEWRLLIYSPVIALNFGLYSRHGISRISNFYTELTQV